MRCLTIKLQPIKLQPLYYTTSSFLLNIIQTFLPCSNNDLTLVVERCIYIIQKQIVF